MGIKLMVIKFFGTIIMLRFAKTKVARKKFYDAKQKKKKKEKKKLGMLILIVYLSQT